MVVPGCKVSSLGGGDKGKGSVLGGLGRLLDGHQKTALRTVNPFADLAN